ncbi:thiol reductant ABC exporter subunit CydC [Actinoplanes rectilineatus]|uniref:thiol reductant ABC exporter subunit CydC n=1 Tax=Actinoplanes rectilineatus TaxID=113571 RepID=UPI0005F28019|nr:thiol reductant ABC exporter subunit CydC [Actinoplanes rectilineatus]
MTVLRAYPLIKPAAGRLALAVLAGAGAAGAAVALTAVSAWLISRAALHPPVLHLMVAIVAVRAFGLSRGVLRYLERLIGHDAAFRILGDVRARLFTRLERLAPAGLADFRRADLAQRLAADVDAVLDLVTRVALPYAVAAVVGLAAVLVVGALVPVAGLTLAVALLVVAIGVPLLQRAAARRADGRLAPLRGELTTGVVDLLHGLADFSVYGAQQSRLSRLDDVDARMTQASRRSANVAGLSAAVTVLSTGVCVLVGLAAGAVAVRSGALPGELLALVVLTPMAVFEIAGPLPMAAQTYVSARASMRRLAELWDAPSPLSSLGSSPATPVFSDIPEIRVENVTAGWVPGRTAVSGVSLTLPPGGRVALVGPSGSGKSTVAALLVRFLDPRAGRVTLDGTDLRSIVPERVREVVGYLPEDAYLFDTTIGDNLRIARPDATGAALEQALASARLLDWVRTLPDGLDTLVGEHGMALSGGQRRRLALARILLGDARVLILDEPTEHLDDETAGELTRDLLAAAGHRSVLLITHREADLDGLDVVRL